MRQRVSKLGNSRHEQKKRVFLGNTSLIKDNQTVVNQTAQQADANYYKN